MRLATQGKHRNFHSPRLHLGARLRLSAAVALLVVLLPIASHDVDAQGTPPGRTATPEVNAVAFSPDGSLLADADAAGTVTIWDVATSTQVRSFGVGNAAVTGLSFSPDGATLATSGRDSVVRSWDVRSGQLLHEMHGHGEPALAVVFSPDGTTIFSAGEDTKILAWDAASGRLLAVLSTHRGFVRALATSPAGLLVSGSDDGTARIVNAATRQELNSVRLPSGRVTSVAVTPDGSRIATGSSDGATTEWDVTTGAAVDTDQGASGEVNGLAYAPDGQTIVSADNGGNIRLRGRASGQKIETGPGRGNAVRSVTVSPDSQVVASANKDGTIGLWDAATGKEKATLQPTGRRSASAAPGKGKQAGAITAAQTVGPQAALDQGPGGPILLLTSTASSNPFGSYYPEILRNEGFNAFQVADISAVTPTTLSAYDVVILTEMSLSSAQVTMLSDWVNAGGNLVSMRPDAQLATLLGLSGPSGSLSNGYLLVNTATAPGAGIVGETIQYKGVADRYTPSGASTVATLYSNATAATSNPAVTLRSVGSNGGQAAAFAYDLARSIVYLRQGNPAWVDQERDGTSPIRSDDLYYGAASFDPQPDWIDLNKVAIPQADEQQRLLANLILEMNRDKEPLPRFWYLPRGLDAAIVMTGDDHGNGGTSGRFDDFISKSPPNCSVADWECVRGTSYIYPFTPISNAQAANYNSLGFEIGLHVNTGCSDYTPSELESYYASQLSDWQANFPSLPPPSTNRTHCIPWDGWTVQPDVELNHAIRLDTNYYYWPPNWVADRPGFFTGSGMPMRFMNLNGGMIDVYQAPSQMTDESGQSYPLTPNALLDGAIGPQQFFGVFTINAHTDVASSEASDATVSSAQARGIPVVSSRQMLEWLDGRNSSTYSNLAWSGSILTFTVAPGAGANGLQVMVPLISAAGPLSAVTVNGSPVSYTARDIKGVSYAFVNAAAGSFAVTYAPDSTPPTVTASTPPGGATGVSATSAVTATFSEAMDATTIDATTFELHQGSPSGTTVPASVTYDATARVATLQPSSPLSFSTSYTAIVKGGSAGVKDVTGNALASDFSWSFTTASGPVCPCNIWGPTDTPATASADDTASVELGVRFRTDVDGFITGVRFYKGSANTGTHVGTLWSSTGTALATVTFQNETASGWQEAAFSNPVAVTANTTYVASYFAPAGGYAYTSNYFASSGADAPPLHALQDGVDGGNGVYVYGSSAGFPDNTYNATNYWVDVVFQTGAGDTTPPTVTGRAPAAGATNVSTSTPVTASFSEAMDASTISTSTFELREGGASGALVSATVSYDSGTHAATLQPASALTAGTAYTAIVKGGSGGVKDAAGNAMATDEVWTFTTAGGPDTTPPTVTGRAPASNATNVSTTTVVTATFSEAMDPATISTSTFELRQGGPAGTPVPATVSYDTVSQAATLQPSGPLANSTTFTAIVRGGANGAKDVAGNALAADDSWSFTTAAPGPVCPCSIWAPTATPGLVSDPDTSSVELGVKFRADVDGYISGIRFYKGTSNTGTHTGSLWTSSGTLLGQLTFSNETASGWQQADFAPPIAITANTTYIASYHAPVGSYSADTGFFSSAVNNPPLHALANGTDGPNGVYAYSSGPAFPTSSYQSSNYWVDVVFITSVGPDTTPPVIISRTPSPNATGVSVSSSVTATFNEAMDASSISSTSFELHQGGAGGALVPSTVSYDAPTRTVTLQPTAPFATSTSYTAIVKGGAGGVRDSAGNPLAADDAWAFTTQSPGPCSSPANAVVAENCLTGNPASEWDISGAGDPSIQGFATDISVNRGGTISFKIDTNATNYRIDIYRLGYYNGDGARKVATVQPSASLPQNQPNCLNQGTTGLIDCGNWAVSASWAVPSTSVSGVYIARLVRLDTNGASHIPFIVRDDAGASALLFQTSDTTWQAYNDYGGNSLYTGSPAGRAYKVSYNRPFHTRAVDAGQDFLFNAEYPMIRFLERNGYDVSYISEIDTDRFGSLLLNHQVFMSVGHDEYWSGGQRANVEAARDAGVNLAFFSGNEVFWKTRWETAIDGSGTPYRTLVCYKETHDNATTDPQDPPTWTGTWRDPRFSPPADGGRPENALTGTIFMVNDGATTSIRVPEADGKMRIWRNTSIATLSPGQTATLPDGTLGYEWDVDADNGFRPGGLIRLSTTTVNGAPVLQDYGSTYGSGTATHSLTLYRSASGALVFGAGTVQWAWGLDDIHDRGGTPSDVRMQQATINLLADMSVLPITLQSGLVPATPSTDATPPASTITSPAAGSSVGTNTAITVTGTATDAGGGVVGGVEVSTDGGATWHPATGRGSWTYAFTTPSSPGTLTIQSRATDDSARTETPSAGVTINVGSDSTPPTVVSTSPADGSTGFNVTANVTATFSESMTASTINATTFELHQGDQTGPLVSATVSYSNTTRIATLNPAASLIQGGVYTAIVKGGATDPRVKDAAGNAMAANYVWSFTAGDGGAPTVIATSPVDGAGGFVITANVTATFSEAMTASTINATTFQLHQGGPGGPLVPAGVTYNGTSRVATLNPTATLLPGTVYTAILKGGATDPRVKDSAGNALAADYVWSFTTAGTQPGSILFDASNDWINVPNSASLGINTNLTAEAWIKPTGISSRRAVVVKGNWQLDVEPTGSNFRVVFRTRSGSVWRNLVSGGFAYGSWYHIAATYDGATMKIWVNGAQAASLNATGLIDTSTASLRIGALSGSSGFFAGNIDEVRISNTVRYTANFTPPNAPFTPDGNTAGLWHFDEGAGTVAGDSSGNNNTGTLRNAPTWSAETPFP